MSEHWSQRRVLVTGANGFVGGWLSKRLVSLGAAVIALVRDAAPGGLQLHGLTGSVISVRGDLNDERLLARVLNEYEIDDVFHLAAQSIVSVAARNPISTFESNIRGTWTLLEQCRIARPAACVVVSTSDKVYGDQTPDPLAEDAPLLGFFPYDASKVCADLISRCYAATFGLRVAVVRCANIYGGGDLNFSRIVPYAVQCILTGSRVLLRTDGTHRREYLYVEDAVSGLLAAGERLECECVRGEAFNLGSGEALDVISLIRCIEKIAGRPPSEVVQAKGAGSGEILCQSLNWSKAAKVLGWRPTVKTELGLKHTLDWYRAHLDV
jgi:CDP-glucose 4,6-dehydratase